MKEGAPLFFSREHGILLCDGKYTMWTVLC